MAWALFIGLNAAVWSTVGIIRFIVESSARGRWRERVRHFFVLARHALYDQRTLRPDLRASMLGGCSGTIFFTVLVTFDTESFLGGSFPERIFVATCLLWVFSATAAGFLSGAIAASRGHSRHIIGSGMLAGSLLALFELLLAFTMLAGLDPLSTTEIGRAHV